MMNLDNHNKVFPYHYYDDRSYDMIFGIKRSKLYHYKRYCFYDMFFPVFICVWTILNAIMVYLPIFDINTFNYIPISMFIIMNCIGFYFLFHVIKRLNLHWLLEMKFSFLERRIPNDSFTDDEYESIKNERLEIEKDEPPIKRLVDVMCHYDMLRSLGDETDHPDISGWRRKFAHFISQSKYAYSFLDDKYK